MTSASENFENFRKAFSFCFGDVDHNKNAADQTVDWKRQHQSAHPNQRNDGLEILQNDESEYPWQAETENVNVALDLK